MYTSCGGIPFSRWQLTLESLHSHYGSTGVLRTNPLSSCFPNLTKLPLPYSDTKLLTHIHTRRNQFSNLEYLTL